MTTRRIVAILTASIGLTAGCVPRDANRSPTPDQDPERYARAVREADDVRRQNQEAEAQFFRRLGQPDLDLPEPRPTDLVSSPNDPEIPDPNPGEDTP